MKHGENPVDDHNHALAALRYLISRLDAHFIARLRKPIPPPEHHGADGMDTEHLWTRLS
jgi:hypothetical protein